MSLFSLTSTILTISKRLSNKVLMLIGLVYLGSVGYVLDEKDAHNLNGIKDQPQCVNVN